ncbi:hypothetical protein HY492_01310 [Candidatus Woesearchaeota archaeon]|nr:hypothetical protein [Candidatus Woesearchaeota archaeon]
MKTALKLLQISSLAMAILLVIAFVFAILGKLNWIQFFLLAALFALCAYVIIPRIRGVLSRHP